MWSHAPGPVRADLGTAKWLPVGHETCSDAARKGRLGLVTWTRENSFRGMSGHVTWWPTATIFTFFGGRAITVVHGTSGCVTERLHVLKWAREVSCPWDEQNCYGATVEGVSTFFGGHSSTLALCMRTRCAAARRGNLQMLHWAS